MSDISNASVVGAGGLFGQWAAYIGMTLLLSCSSLTTAGAEGVVLAVVDADREWAWTGWT
jgi:hypothetical protein